MPRRRRRTLPSVDAIADRQPSDIVARRNGRLYLVDTNGAFAPVEIRDEETEGWPKFQENVAKMTRADEINRSWLALLQHPWITEEGRQLRIALLRQRWRELFGDAMFVVND